MQQNLFTGTAYIKRFCEKFQKEKTAKKLFICLQNVWMIEKLSQLSWQKKACPAQRGVTPSRLAEKCCKGENSSCSMHSPQTETTVVSPPLLLISKQFGRIRKQGRSADLLGTGEWQTGFSSWRTVEPWSPGGRCQGARFPAPHSTLIGLQGLNGCSWWVTENLEWDSLLP